MYLYSAKSQKQSPQDALYYEVKTYSNKRGKQPSVRKHLTTNPSMERE